MKDIDWTGFDAAAEEIRLAREAREKRILQERLSTIICLDCGATLKLTSSSPLPEDLQVVFVEHGC